MSARRIFFDPEGTYFGTYVYSIYRWGSMTERPGTYKVVCGIETLNFIQFSVPPGTYRHPTCVVDDFGSLVRVGDMQ